MNIYIDIYNKLIDTLIYKDVSIEDLGYRFILLSFFIDRDRFI
jgi:hypothetical protein